jgi:sugar phosphate permease
MGSRAALLVLAGFSLGAAGLAAGWLVEGPVDADIDDEADALRHPLRDRRIWRLSFGSAVMSCTQVAITGFVVLFLESQRGLTAAGAGLVLAAINVVGAAGRLVSGRRSDRRGGGRVALIRAIAAATAVAVTATVETAGPRRSGAALGLQQTLLGASIVVTPLAFAPFVQSTSWRAGFFVAAALPLVAVLVLRPLRT